MKYIEKSILVCLFIMGLIGLQSCEDFLNPEPANELLKDQFFRDKHDADAIILGIYGKFVNLGPQYILLNELRADLMDVTENANIYQRNINLHNVEQGSNNPYTDPTPFFSLINDCNDAIKHFKIMRNELKMSEEEFDQRYSDIATLRSWLYFQLVIHYGEIPYITEPIEDVKDLLSINEKNLNTLTIEEMVDSLLFLMESLPYQGLYTDPSFSAYSTVIDNRSVRIMFIDKEYFLGDLYLWDGQYNRAATVYRAITERDINQNEYDTYKVPYGDINILSNYTSGYVRYYWDDVYSKVNNWEDMFSDKYPIDNNNYYCEWIWVLYYDDNYEPYNPFNNDYFYNYYYKPSQLIIDDWKAQIQVQGYKGDFRGITGSYDTINGQPVITKHITRYENMSFMLNYGKWGIYRAGGLHLHFAEAANRDGQYKIAYCFINNGIKANYPTPSGENDKTYYEQSLLPPPYDFDARYTSLSQIPPSYRGLWHRHQGIRRRVYLSNIEYDIPSGMDTVTYLENAIIDESARELAFEGQRWTDLVRIAIRRNDPSFLADRIYAKLEKAGYPEAESIRQKLLIRDNWFLPLK